MTKSGILIITPRKIVYFILLWTIISDTLMAEFGFSGSIQYLNDIAWLILLYFIISRNFIGKFRKYGLRSLACIIVLFVFLCYFSSFINFVNPLLVLWATRNSMRFLIFFIAAVIYLDEFDITKIFDILYIVQIISFFIALYQYFALGLHMDNLGGIFGHGNGAALNTFQAMILAFYLLKKKKKKQPIYKVGIILVTSLIIAALAEEKAFFVYLIVVVVGCILLNRPSFKTVIIILAVAIMVPVGINILASVNSAWNLEVLTNFESAMDYMENSYGLSRSNPFPEIQELFFDDSIIKNLFGIGFGASENCDATPLFTSDFFNRYSYLQYYDFTHQKKFLETGILGFGSYLLLFIGIILMCIKNITKYKNDDYRVKAMLIFTVVAILSCWFSGALIYNDAYIIYFGLAAGVILCKHRNFEESIK